MDKSTWYNLIQEDENSESSKLNSKNKNQPNEKLVYEPNLQTDIPFDIEEIQYQKRTLLSIGNSSKKDVIEKVSQKYKDISVIQMEVPEKNTINPSFFIVSPLKLILFVIPKIFKGLVRRHHFVNCLFNVAVVYIAYNIYKEYVLKRITYIGS